MEEVEVLRSCGVEVAAADSTHSRHKPGVAVGADLTHSPCKPAVAGDTWPVAQLALRLLNHS